MTTKMLKIKTAALTTATIIISATLLSAPAAMATLKTRTKSNQCNERGATACETDLAKRCAMGKHFATVDLSKRKAGTDEGGFSCDAAIVEQEMTSCNTDGSVFSWGSNDKGQLRSQSDIVFRDDGTAGDRVTATNTDSNLGEAYATPKLALCSALQKATMAINADPEKLSALGAKVSVHDFNVMTRQLLLDNGVPADLLGDPADAAAGRRKFFRLKENVRSGSEAPISLQITINWDSATSGSKDYVGHVSLIKL